VSVVVYHCYFCDAELLSNPGLTQHIQQKHPKMYDIVYQAAVNQYRGVTPMPIPTHPSNRSFIKQMKKWGWGQGPTRQDWVTMTFSPDGEEPRTLKVRPAHFHDGNPAAVFLSAYELTGVTGEDFWDGPPFSHPAPAPEPEPEAEPSAAPTKIRRTRTPGISRGILEVLLTEGRPMTNQALAARLGLSQHQVSDSAAYLAQQGLVSRLVRGMYQARVTNETVRDIEEIIHRQVIVHDAQHGIASLGPSLDDPQPEAAAPEPEPVTEPPAPISAAPPVPALPPTPAPVPTPRPVAEISDEEILAVLDMLSPSGFRATHLPAINRWVEATRELLVHIQS
jgi:hypothetical protein